MDTKVLMTQQWLNETYAGTSGYSAVDEDGITGMGTIRALIWALQTELGISADGVFGDGTAKAFTALSTESDSSITTINHQIHILQGALYCKGQGLDPIYLNGVYTDTTKEAVRKFQEYAGLSTTDQTGIANAEVMKALLNTDAYTLLRSGDSKIREIQQALNNKYHSYIGLIPCDGLFTKKTMRALISGLQVEQKKEYSNNVVDGVWGPTTMNRCPTLQRYGTITNKQYVYILQYALYANGFDPNGFDGGFGNGVQTAVKAFQKFSALALDGIVGKRTWASLLVSYGDQSRIGTACDFSVPLTAAKAQALVENGRTIVGRYISGTTKKLTRDEMKVIYNAGLKVFPIYQITNNYRNYFSAGRGRRDAYYAIEALRNLYFPDGTTVYFAVDFDATVDDVNGYVIPYFKAIKEEFDKFGSDKYKVGIYGPRYVCTLVKEAGYSVSSFVCDMSAGFACNIGFPLPKDWAFDQISTLTLGTGDAAIEIDNNIASGRNNGILIDPEQAAEQIESEKYIKRTNIVSKICDCHKLPNGYEIWNDSFTFGTKYLLLSNGVMDVYMTASLTHGNSDNVVNTVTITNGNFDDATITTQLGQMLASVNLTLDDAELPNLELLAAEIQNGKMELALSVNPADSSVTLAITSVVYDTQAYVPSSVEVAVTVEYVFHTNLSTPTPAYEPYYEKVLERVNEYIKLATKAIANTLLIIFMFAVAAAVAYGTISTGTVLLSLLTCLFVR